MTRVSFFQEGKLFTGFRAEGHTGYAPAGSDIVCAGVSALLQSTVIALDELLGIPVELKTEKKTGLFICRLPAALTGEQQEKADLLFRSAYLGLLRMANEYPEHLRVAIKGGAKDAEAF
ncbi:MAG: ribosomal-processing cysteine protease Prp [Clostridia bacterium]|nr:ribosomal-processing cysteine protease Prp [Clostridia bacterium]